MRILICAGGTGGHVYPALAVADSLRTARAVAGDLQILWIGSEDGMEVEMVREAGIKMETIPAGGVVGKGLRNGLIGLTKLAAGSVHALRIMSHFPPDAVFVTGGYMAVPVNLAGWLRKVPIAVYLPDVQPGAAVRWAARFSRKVLVTMVQSQEYFKNKCVTVTGYPLRREIVLATRQTRQTALDRFNLRVERSTVLVVGGSRGARSINRAALIAGPDWIEAGVQVLHVTGQLDWRAVKKIHAQFAVENRAHYHIFPYLNDAMGLALRAADLAVARAGASCLGEFPAFGLPALLVPYPYGWRYQISNAELLSDRGAADWIEDQQLQQALGPTVANLLQNQSRLAAMGRQASKLAVPDAADRVAAELIAMTAGAG